MESYSLPELIERVNTLTKDNYTKYKYQLRAGNLIYEMDNFVRRSLFGKDTAFRIVKNHDKASVDIERERLISFIIQYDLLKSEGYDEYLQALADIEVGEYNLPSSEQLHIKKLKKMAKSSRIEEDSLLKQILFQMVYDTTFRFSNDLERDNFLNKYFDEYIVDDLSKRISFELKDPDIISACQMFATRISGRLSSSLQGFHMEAPVVSGKHSPMGHKCDDQDYIARHIVSEQVWVGVKGNIQKRIRAMKALNMSARVLENIHYVDEFNEESLKCFAPKVNAIESTEFKPRIVYQSSDLDDVLLDPFMRFLKLCESFCKCSFSTYRPNDGRLNSKYSVARMVSENALDMLHCGESNSDLTMATDKLSGNLEKEMFMTFIRALRPDVRNMMDELNLTEEYFEACFDIINHSLVWTKLSDGTIRTGYCKCGQCQGERGSFHNLHFQNMMFGLAAYLKQGLTYDQWEETSIYQGDDADVPDKVQKDYASLWINHSLPGVASLDKTASESEEGALLFCKSYIKTGKPSPKMINGLKFNQLMRIFNDPQQMSDFTTFDIFQDRLIGRLRKIMRHIHDRYEIFGVLPNYCDSAYNREQRNRIFHWKSAQKYASHELIMNCFHPIYDLDYKPTAFIGLCPEMVPYNRAKNLVIRHDYMPFDVYLGAISLQRYTTIIQENSQITHPLKDLDEFFSEYRDDYVMNGIIPNCDYRIPEYIWNRTLSILYMSGIPKGSYTIEDVTPILEDNYAFSYYGYSNDTHVIKVSLDLR